MFKGAFYYCEGPDIKNVKNRTDCVADKRNQWVNRKYNFDDLGKALMSLFVLSSRDGWVNIMYTGLDAVGVDQQVTSQPIGSDVMVVELGLGFFFIYQSLRLQCYHTHICK